MYYFSLLQVRKSKRVSLGLKSRWWQDYAIFLEALGRVCFLAHLFWQSSGPCSFRTEGLVFLLTGGWAKEPHLLALHLADWPICLSPLFSKAHVIRIGSTQIIQCNLPIPKSQSHVWSSFCQVKQHIHGVPRISDAGSLAGHCPVCYIYCDNPYPAKPSSDTESHQARPDQRNVCWIHGTVRNNTLKPVNLGCTKVSLMISTNQRGAPNPQLEAIHTRLYKQIYIHIHTWNVGERFEGRTNPW